MGAGPVQLLLTWLEATRHLKSLEHKDETAEAYAALMASTNEEQARLVRQMPSMNRETLRRARVRLDCVAMLIVRAFMAMLTPDSVSLHLFIDESPQKRGRMLLASSLDVCHRVHEMRLLLPSVCLARGCLGTLGKLAGLVWQLFLSIGMTQLRAFCDASGALPLAWVPSAFWQPLTTTSNCCCATSAAPRSSCRRMWGASPFALQCIFAGGATLGTW